MKDVDSDLRLEQTDEEGPWQGEARTLEQGPHAYLPRQLCVCGPSGVGKSTLIERLHQEYPGMLGFCASHTTRAPRPGECAGAVLR